MSVRAAQNTDGARKAFSNWEPALQMMEEESRHSGGGGKEQYQCGTHQCNTSRSSSITPADPECVGHTAMCDDIAGPFDCCNIIINRHYQQRATSAGIHGNAPHVITKEAFQSWKVRQVLPEWVISEVSSRALLGRVSSSRLLPSSRSDH